MRRFRLTLGVLALAAACVWLLRARAAPRSAPVPLPNLLLRTGSSLRAPARPTSPAAGASPSLDPVQATAARGWDLMDAGRYAEAAKVFSDALVLRPNEESPRIGRARALAYEALSEAMGPRPGDALFTVDAARDAGAEPSLLAKARGIALARIGEADHAIDALEEALQGRPDDLEVLEPLASLDYRRGRLDKAREVLRRLVRLDPEDADARAFLDQVEREAPVEQGFHSDESSHFLVRYEGDTNAVAGQWVVQILEEAYRKVGADFGIYPAGQVSVILYSGRQFREVTGSPDWMGAVYDGQIRVPIGGLEGRTRELERMLYHEYTHAVVRSVAGDRCPTWLQEGLAQYEEGAGSNERAQAAQILAGLPSMPSIASLEGSFVGFDSARARVAYAASFSFTSYLVDGYGMGRLQDLLKEVGNGIAPDVALQDVYRLGYGDLTPMWWSSLQANR